MAWSLSTGGIETLSSKKDEWMPWRQRSGPMGARVTRFAIRAVLLAACAVLLLELPAHAALRKGAWGPVKLHGVSQFPVYKKLGVTVYNTRLDWRSVAVRRPTHPRDPRDP